MVRPWAFVLVICLCFCLSCALDGTCLLSQHRHLSRPLPSSLSRDAVASATAQPFLGSPLRPGWAVGLIEVCSSAVKNHLFHQRLLRATADTT